MESLLPFQWEVFQEQNINYSILNGTVYDRGLSIEVFRATPWMEFQKNLKKLWVFFWLYCRIVVRLYAYVKMKFQQFKEQAHE